MKNENIDKRFALIAYNKEILFPYMKKQKSTGRYGFALTAPGEQDRKGKGHYTLDMAEVIKNLVFNGWSARVKTISREGKQREGSLGIGKHSIVGYWISDELKHLVKDAKVKPQELPEKQNPGNSLVKSNEKSPRNRIESAVEKESTDVDADKFSLESAIDEIVNEYQNKPGEDIDAVIKRRVGQSAFRKLLERKYGSKCHVSGLAKRTLLIASHIVPWSKSSKEEKTDHENGLLLSVNWDALFDKGFISFDIKGNVIFSDEIDDESIDLLGIDKNLRLRESLLTTRRLDYLKRHREEIFEKWKKAD